jgi:hypothetical protein
MQTAGASRPRFRQDLVAETVDDRGARFIDVMDPDSGNMFRFYEVEYSLACAMDGERDIAGIVKWAQEELGLSPSAKEVQSVIATLVDLNFVDTGEARSTDSGKAASAISPSGSDQELARGIVVGARPEDLRKTSPTNDVELGNAGGGRAAPVAESPTAPDFALGAPGAAARVAPSAPVEDIPLGAPGVRAPEAKPIAKPAPVVEKQSDVSIDLSEHLSVKPDDVKEAVRASKVMNAAEVPKELLDALEDQPAEKPAKAPEKVAKAPEKVAEKPVEKAAKAPEKVVEKPVEKAVAKAPEKVAEKPVEKAAKAPEKAATAKPAVELPKQPVAEKVPVAPPAPRGGISPVLVVLLILAIVGAGAFFVWKYVIDKPDAVDTSAQNTPPPPAPVPPPPPPVVTSKIAMETPTPREVKSPAGTIDTLEASDKDVKAGDVVGMLAGHKPITAEIEAINKDIEKRVQVELTAAEKVRDAAQAAGNKAGLTAALAKVADRKKSLDTKHATLTAKKAELDKLTLKSPGEGKLSVVAKPGQKVVADEVVATIVRPTVPVATFKVPVGTKIAPDGSLSISMGDKTVVCTVSDAQQETVKVTCPTDAGLAAGSDVTFKLPQ